MKRILISIFCFCLPSKVSIFFLRLLGCSISYRCKIGFSVILVESLSMSDSVRIGHFNFIKCKKLDMGPGAYIGMLNIIKGPFEILLAKTAAIGNSNHISRAPLGITTGISQLILGELSKITASHRVDLTKSVIMGDFTTIAGSGSQIWTHGFFHYPEGPGRYRVDGEVILGNNVYIGSCVVVNAGIKLGNGITIGSNACVSKSLSEQGMYVSQPLRYIPYDLEHMKDKLVFDESNHQETVYLKNVR